MNINNVNNNNTPPIKVDEHTPAERASADGSATSAKRKDSVELTQDVTRFGHLEAEIRGADEIDHDHVAAIKDQIAQGRYHVDPERLAAKIIELEDFL